MGRHRSQSWWWSLGCNQMAARTFWFSVVFALSPTVFIMLMSVVAERLLAETITHSTIHIYIRIIISTYHPRHTRYTYVDFKWWFISWMPMVYREKHEKKKCWRKWTRASSVNACWADCVCVDSKQNVCMKFNLAPLILVMWHRCENVEHNTA